MISQIQIYGSECEFCRQHFEGSEQLHLSEECLVTHTHSWEKGDFAQVRFSKYVTEYLLENRYAQRRRFIHKKTPRSKHGYDDILIDIDNCEGVASDTKNAIQAGYTSSYMKEQFLAKDSCYLYNDINLLAPAPSFWKRSAKRVELIGKALVIFGKVENSCLTLCRNEGVELIHEYEHCLAEQNEEALRRAAKKFVDYAMEQFKRRDNQRAFDRLWSRVHSGKRLQFTHGKTSEEASSEENTIDTNTTNTNRKTLQQKAERIYRTLIANATKDLSVLQCFYYFRSREIISGTHRLASEDSFTVISSDSNHIRMNLPLYQAFVDNLVSEE